MEYLLNRINYKSITSVFSVFLFLLLPLAKIFAEINNPPSPVSQKASKTTIDNPLGSSDINVLLTNVMNIVAVVGGIVLVIFIIYSGYKFVTAQGKPEKISEAKDMFWATIIGGAILLGADVIANVVVNTIYTTTHL